MHNHNQLFINNSSRYERTNQAANRRHRLKRRKKKLETEGKNVGTTTRRRIKSHPILNEFKVSAILFVCFPFARQLWIRMVHLPFARIHSAIAIVMAATQCRICESISNSQNITYMIWTDDQLCAYDTARLRTATPYTFCDTAPHRVAHCRIYGWMLICTSHSHTQIYGQPV